MKSLNFKRKESAIRGLEIQQESKAKKPRNWDRIIYFIILSILMLFLVRYIINNYVYIEADGEILFDSIDIRNTDDCRIIKYFKEEGDEVCIGDSLFSFLPDEPEGSFNAYGTYEFAMGQTKEYDISWAEKQIFQTKEEIKLNNYLLKEKVKLKQLLESDLTRIRQEVMLDVLPRHRLDDQLAKINAMNYEIEALKGKTKLLNESLAGLQKLIRNRDSKTNASGSGDGGGSGFNSGNPGRIFYSPLEGTITNILKNEFEVALKDEVILSIHKPENIYIKGFFKQEDLKYLQVGDKVKLEFPDGSKGTGLIKRFYFTTYKLPEEFQKKYEPTTRSLSADIYPASDEELKKWKAFWKMGVKIRKLKF